MENKACFPEGNENIWAHEVLIQKNEWLSQAIQRVLSEIVDKRFNATFPSLDHADQELILTLTHNASRLPMFLWREKAEYKVWGKAYKDLVSLVFSDESFFLEIKNKTWKEPQINIQGLEKVEVVLWSQVYTQLAIKWPNNSEINEHNIKIYNHSEIPEAPPTSNFIKWAIDETLATASPMIALWGMTTEQFIEMFQNLDIKTMLLDMYNDISSIPESYYEAGKKMATIILSLLGIGAWLGSMVKNIGKLTWRKAMQNSWTIVHGITSLWESVMRERAIKKLIQFTQDSSKQNNPKIHQLATNIEKWYESKMSTTLKIVAAWGVVTMSTTAMVFADDLEDTMSTANDLLPENPDLVEVLLWAYIKRNRIPNS